METLYDLIHKVGLANVLGGALGALLLPLLWKTARKKVVAAVGAFLRLELKKAFHPDFGNEAQKAAFVTMVKSIVAYAEICIPDTGMGPQKMALVKDYLLKLGFLDEKNADAIVGIINAAVQEANAALKEAQCADAVPLVPPAGYELHPPDPSCPMPGNQCAVPIKPPAPKE